jgi:hypothetical protein
MTGYFLQRQAALFLRIRESLLHRDKAAFMARLGLAALFLLAADSSATEFSFDDCRQDSSIRTLKLSGVAELSAGIVRMSGPPPDYGLSSSPFIHEARLGPEDLRAIYSTFQMPNDQKSWLDIDIPSFLTVVMRPRHGLECHVQMPDSLAMQAFCYDPLLNFHGWITAADLNLPCFDTDYHRMVKDINCTYGRWKKYYGSRLLRSLRGPDDLNFIWIIEWLGNRPALKL